ncbi:MAG: hypothetical protein RL497_966 [Pseudomonadota bacterium]
MLIQCLYCQPEPQPLAPPMLRLILPILFPSWRFFNSIGPSPRILVRFDEAPWQEFCPKPARLNLLSRIGNLFHNPRGNKTLFIQSCAVRLFDEIDPVSCENLFLALAQAIVLGQLNPPSSEAMIAWRVEQLNWEPDWPRGQIKSEPDWPQGQIKSEPVSGSIIYTSEARSVSSLLQQWQQDTHLCF